MAGTYLWARASSTFWCDVDHYLTEIGVSKKGKATLFMGWLKRFIDLDQWHRLVLMDECPQATTVQRKLTLSNDSILKVEEVLTNLEQSVAQLVQSGEFSQEQAKLRLDSLKSRLVKTVFRHGVVQQWQ